VRGKERDEKEAYIDWNENLFQAFQCDKLNYIYIYVHRSVLNTIHKAQ